jgi:hypothetical protein
MVLLVFGRMKVHIGPVTVLDNIDSKGRLILMILTMSQAHCTYLLEKDFMMNLRLRIITKC